MYFFENVYFLKKHLEKTQKDFELVKFSQKIKETDLEQRLTSSIDHVTFLNNKVTFYL